VSRGETALVVVIPEVEPLVAPWRERFTADGARGMPPHVTLLYPFADEAEVNDVLTDVEDALAPFAPFEATFARTARWPDVLYLEPAQPRPFVALVEALAAAFPQYPPTAVRTSRSCRISPSLTASPRIWRRSRRRYVRRSPWPSASSACG
jgi:hypothetical protein